MAKSTENVPTVKEEAALPTTTPIVDFSADMETGFEDADSSSYAIPFLRQLQATSGQCKKQDPDYIKGAEEGDFYNTVTEKVYKSEDGIIVVPCHYNHKYNEWAPDRGGFRGSHDVAGYSGLTKTKLKDNKGNEYEANAETGNALQDTREHYVLIVNPDGTTEPALLCLSSTQMKKSKKWMTLMQGIRINGQTAPMFSQRYKLSTVGESNDKGSWAGIKIEHVGQVTSVEEYKAAKQFREMVRAGTAKAVAPDDLPY